MRRVFSAIFFSFALSNSSARGIYSPGSGSSAARNSFATLYGVIDGKVYSAVIDMNAYANFLNRYGASLFIA